MTEIIKQYGQMLIAFAGTMGFFFIMGGLFFSNDGLLIRMMQLWINGGC